MKIIYNDILKENKLIKEYKVGNTIIKNYIPKNSQGKNIERFYHEIINLYKE